MSKWHDMDIEHISFSNDGKDIHIWYKQVDDGNCYVSVKTEDMRTKLKEIK